MSKLIATAPTKERLLKIIADFHCSENCIISEGNRVINTKLQKELGEVKEKGKRYQYWIG